MEPRVQPREHSHTWLPWLTGVRTASSNPESQPHCASQKLLKGMSEAAGGADKLQLVALKEEGERLQMCRKAVSMVKALLALGWSVMVKPATATPMSPY